jgi:clan AA aspartic protease
MGEVRAKVKLTNATDESLERRGQLSSDKVRSYEADALVDTGAVSLVLPVFVMQELGLMPAHRRVVEYADGRKEPVDVTEPVTIRINGRLTFDEALVLGDEVLIGQTVLEKLDLFVDSRGRRLVPNPEHPDQPVSNVK